MSVDEPINFGEEVKVKVNRYNSKVNRLRRWIAGNPHFVQIQERAPVGSAKVTVYVRRYNAETKELGPIQYIERDKPNLKPNTGLTFFLQQCYAGNSGGSVGTNGTNFMAVTTTAVTPAAGDTTLTGEATTNGFARAQATVVISQPTATISNTYTATGTMTNLQAGALFTASSVGTMGHEFTYTATTCNSGDQLTIQVTITIS